MIQWKTALVIALCMVVYFGVSPALAVPAAPIIHTLEQKDGSAFMAKLWGDERSHGWETTDRYSIIFDETTKDWTYAIPGADGNLVSSANIVGRASPPNNIPEHIRPRGQSQLKILNVKASVASGVPDNAVPATGTANIPVILINFNDRSTTYTAANFNTLLFGSGTKSMKDYYEEVSYGKFSVSPGPGGVAGWYTASQNHDYYGQNDASGRDRWLGTLVREAVTAADPAFNFTPYDKDSDCYVDVVDIIHQGSGEEYGGPSTDIWSKSWDLRSAYYYGYSNGGEYTTNDPCPAGGFIKVDDFVIEPETLGGSQPTIGIFAHEYGHALGLPDLYDTTDSSEGIGTWSLMAAGNWNGISRSGDTPAHPDAWSKSLLGWVSPTHVSTSSVTQIKRVEDNSVVYQLLDNPNGVNDWNWISGTGEGEYFLVENRRKIGFDAALSGEGLLIWHIDESIGNNDNKIHKLVDLEEADGRNDLDSKNNRGDASDPWYTSPVGFTEVTTPNSKLYNGSVSGVRVTNISASATIMTATFTVGTLTGAVSTITVIPGTASLTAGQTQQFSVIARDAGGNTVPILPTWTSSNPAVGTISSTGLFTAIANGTATVTARDPVSGISGTAIVTVVTASVGTVTRSMPATAAPGANMTVTLTPGATFPTSPGWGVTETLPAGWTFVCTTANDHLVMAGMGFVAVRFTQLSATPITYTVTAPAASGAYNFSGTFVDGNADYGTVGGQTSVTVGTVVSPVQRYDINGIPGIQKAEAVAAITDYLFNRTLSKADAMTVLTAYLFPLPSLNGGNERKNEN